MTTAVSSATGGVSPHYSASGSEHIDMLPLPNPFYEKSNPEVLLTSNSYQAPIRNLRQKLGEGGISLFARLQARRQVAKIHLRRKKGGNYAA